MPWIAIPNLNFFGDDEDLSIEYNFESRPSIFGAEQKTVVLREEDPEMEKFELRKNGVKQHVDAKITRLDLNYDLTQPVPKGIFNFFPSIVALHINHSSLKKVSRDYFKGFFALKELFMMNNQIVCLPGNLFDYMPNLEIVSFKGNKIKFIDEEIINSLKKLKYFDLTGNANIDLKFDAIQNKGNVDLAQLKSKIKTKCRIKVEHMEALQRDYEDMEEKYEKTRDNATLLRKRLDCFKRISRPTDYYVSAEMRGFRTHKVLLRLWSPMLKALIDSNPRPDELCIRNKNIPDEVFQDVLNFMYDDSPQVCGDTKLLYKECGKFGMPEFFAKVSNKLKASLDFKNCYKMLLLSNEYDDENLRVAAFKEFKKALRDPSLENDVARQPALIKRIMKEKCDNDESFKVMLHRARPQRSFLPVYIPGLKIF